MSEQIYQSTNLFEAPPQTLAEQIAERLSWDIVFRKIPPGSRMREVELANQFQVGRPLIREVLQKLEVQGLIEMAPWRGARVPLLTETQLSDLFEFAALAFGFVCRLAAERATDEQLDLLGKAAKTLERLAKTADTESYERARVAAHHLLEQCMGETTGILRSRPVVQRLRHQFNIDSVSTPALRKLSAERWRTLVSHLKDHDAPLAEAHARSMVLSSREYAIKALTHYLAEADSV